MTAVQDFKDIASFLISEFGLPAGAVGVAAGLVRGAKFLEKDASDRALHLFSDLLTKGDLKNIGKAGASLIPFVFDKVFGQKPLSFQFVSRSVLATSLFWLVLLVAKNPNWENLKLWAFNSQKYYVLLISIFYILDWLSLVKAKFLIKLVSRHYAVLSSFFFVLLDLFASYLLVFTFNIAFAAMYDLSDLGRLVYDYVNFSTISNYFRVASDQVQINSVFIPSTMLTSVWTFLLFVSCLVAQLLVPIDYLRRFTAFWFRDVEHHPLTAIAKVAATLIVVGALAMKGVRWVYEIP